MRKIETSGGLGPRWPTPNSWEEGGSEEDIILYCYYSVVAFSLHANCRPNIILCL